VFLQPISGPLKRGQSLQIAEMRTPAPGPRASRPHGRGAAAHAANQIAFDFTAAESTQGALKTATNNSPLSLDDEVARVASDYQLQMQAYALAVRELLPTLENDRHNIRVTLHFLDPGVQYNLPQELLSPATCSQAIDEAMAAIVCARDPENFPVLPAAHCRMCNFLELCAAGREWLNRDGHRHTT